MTDQSPRPGACPICGSRDIGRSPSNPAHRTESHQCRSCGARLITTLGLRRSLLIGSLGFVFFFLAIWFISTTGVLSSLPAMWQWIAFFVLTVGTYLACSVQTQRGINYELWIPVNTY